MRVVSGSFVLSFLLIGCVPRIEVVPPKEPVTINMNVKIEHDIRIKADKNAEMLINATELKK